MPQIQLASKKKMLDVINATFLYVESVTQSLGVYVEIFYENGLSEKQEIVSGSKFTQGLKGEKIYKILFVNPSVSVVDITYRYSTVFGYDESRLVGNVSSIATNDYSETNAINGMSYCAELTMMGAVSGIGDGVFARAAAQLWNPAGSGRNLYIEEVDLIFSHVLADYAASISQPFRMRHGVAGPALEITDLNQTVGIINKLNGGQASIASKRGIGIVASRTIEKTLLTYAHAIDDTAKSGPNYLNKKYVSPVIIKPGYGYEIHSISSFALATTTPVNTMMSAIIHWKERAV